MKHFIVEKLLSFRRAPRAGVSLPVRALALLAGFTALPALADSVSISQSPLTTPSQVPNNMVLVPSVEWPTVVTHANNPGVAEGSANYSGAPAYAGYFSPELCYAYHYETTEANRFFYAVTAVGTNHSCNGKTGGTSPDPTNQKLWSGSFMNWSAMQAIDTFRLALTGGYRVKDLSSLTYLEKANSDRVDSSYTPLRRLSANIVDATPSTASSLRTRIGALRNQMWFNQNSGSSLGTIFSYTTPHALAIPLPDGPNPQTFPDGADATTAIPYNPSWQGISMSPAGTTNTTATTSTACGTNEPGCTTATWTCPNGPTGTNTTGTCASQSAQACTSGGYKYFYSDLKCHSSNSVGSSSQASAALCSVAGAGIPANGNNGGNCTLNSYAGTPATYSHTTYGSNQIWAVSVRVRVCDGVDTRGDLCTQYPTGFSKPEGLLQRNASKTRFSLFSYMTQDGGASRRGGVMRARQKLIGPVISGEQPYPQSHLPDDSATGGTGTGRISGIDNPEWDGNTGVFIDNPDSADATATTANVSAGSGSCDSTSTPDGSGCQIKYSGVINYLNRFGQTGTGLLTLKSNDNLSEMYYTALRYLRGLGNVASFSNLTTSPATTKISYYQNTDGLPVIEDWYGNGANSAVTQWTGARTVGKKKDPMLYQCQNTVVLGIGDTATQQESDDYSSDTTSTSVPGSTFAKIDKTTMQTWRNATDAGTGAAVRLDTAGLAYWAHLNDLRPDIPNTLIPATASDARGQSISTYWVDVVELANLKTNTDNQYYNATKYGGFNIPDSFFAANSGNGNAARPASTWFGTTPAASNWNTWTTATQTVGTLNPALSNGNFYEPNNMYLGNNGAAMVASLNAAFTKIAADIAGSGASLAANSTQLGTGTTTYQAVFFTGDWRGDLVAYRVCTGDTSVAGCGTQPAGAIATSAAWKASAQLPTPANRKIYTCTGSCVGQTKAVQLTVQSTSTLTLSPSLDSTTAGGLCLNSACGTGEQAAMVNYLLGTDGTLRKRLTTPLGDIVDSQPVYVGQPSANQYASKSFAATFASFAANTSIKSRNNLIYVAANDGMLHAFFECTLNTSGTCMTSTLHQGQEVYAYLPKAVIASGIAKLGQSSYGTSTNPHQFFNDGELTVMDVQCDASACTNAVGGWATVLVGTTGRGAAKAVYALDVTDPTNIKLLWERSATDGSALDSNSGYIGQMTGKPVISRLADGSWVALMGNGYNSSQDKPALLQFDIATGKLSVYTTTGSSADGLSSPAVWIGDAALTDNVSTKAYGGDLHGNVWAFDLTTTGGAGTKIFTAKTSGGVVQAITAGITITKNPADNQVWIFFGTGSVLNTFTNDQSNTWYGLIVQGTSPVSSATTRGNLVQRTIVAENPATSTSLAVRGISLATTGDMTNKPGWFIDLISPTLGSLGERMVTPNQFQGSLLLGTSRVPSASNADPCNPSGGSGWIMAINPFTGTAGSQSFFDANNNNLFTDDLASVTLPNGTVQYYIAAGVGFAATANNPIFVGHDMLISFSNATTGNVNTRGTVSTLQRLSWRELVVP